MERRSQPGRLAGMVRFRPVLTAALAIACAGCGTASPIGPGAAGNEAEAAATPSPSPAPGSILMPLESGDAGLIDGELACSFGEGGDGVPLMLARADVGARAQGQAVIRMATGPRTLNAGIGGFSTVERGGTFTIDRLTIRVTPGARVPDTGEEVIRSAMLTFTEGGRTQTVQGMWRCGP